MLLASTWITVDEAIVRKGSTKSDGDDEGERGTLALLRHNRP